MRQSELTGWAADGHDPADAQAAGEDAAGEEFGWASEAQRARLEQAWGPSWRDYLGEWLDQRWGPGWEHNPADHKGAWLDGLLPELGAQSATAPVEDVAPADPWSWIPAGHRCELAAAWGGGWPERLQQELDGQWGQGWEGHPGDHKAAWLGQLIPQWFSAAVPEPGTGPDLAAARVTRDALLEQAFTAALDQVPGARELPAEQIEQLRSQFREEYERAAPITEGAGIRR
jgi:hypothetical protein